jgi:hypothetical protein
MKARIILFLIATAVFAQNEKKPAPLNMNGTEFYIEDPYTGKNSYYSLSYYTNYDPKSLNYQSQYYDS